MVEADEFEAGDVYRVKVVRTLKEVRKLAKASFDYFTAIGGVYFRKCK